MDKEPPQSTPCFYGVDVDIEAYDINKIRSIRELGIFELQIEDGTNTFVASDRLIWSSACFYYLICTLPRQAMFTSELTSPASDVLYGPLIYPIGAQEDYLTSHSLVAR
jgi:hypothetical protein